MKPNKTSIGLDDLLKNWEERVQADDAGLSITHTKKEFTFSANELAQLKKIYAMQKLAEELINDKLNLEIIPRVGMTLNGQNRLLFDLSVGRFCLWSPRIAKAKKA